MSNTRTGNPMASALLSVRCEQMEDTALVSVLAFEQAAEKLGRLEKGDSVSVSGPCRFTEWESNGEVRHGVAITAHSVMTAFQRRKKGGYSASQRQQEPIDDDDE